MDETYQAPLPFNETSEDKPLSPEEEALEYYLANGGRKEKRDFQGEERRSIQSKLDREMGVLMGMKVKHSDPSEVAQLINYFQDYAPMSWQEGTSLYKGAAKRIDNAAHTRSGNPESAVRNTYYTYSGYLLSAAEDKEMLDSVLVHPENKSIAPDLTLLRNSPEALGVIAKQLMARGFLWDKHGKYWPREGSKEYKERQKYWHGFTIASARFASDESMEVLYGFGRDRADKRFRDWLGQMEQIENMPMVGRLEAEGKILPITFSKLWMRKAHQLELQVNSSPQPEPKPKEAINWDAMVPMEARQAIEEQRGREQELAALYEAEWDREFEKKLQIPMMTPERARKELRDQGLGRTALSEERHEEEYRREVEEISTRAHKARRPKKNRRQGGARKFPALSPWVRKQPGYEKRSPQDSLF